MINGCIQYGKKEANTSFDFELLSEEDIPSASLNGKPLGS